MVPDLVAPIGPVPNRPVFLVSEDPAYRWIRAGRVVRVDSPQTQKGHPALVRAMLCALPCRLTDPWRPGRPSRKCNDPDPAIRVGGSCSVLYGGPTRMDQRSAAIDRIEDYLRVLNTVIRATGPQGGFEGDPDVGLDSWRLERLEMLPVIHHQRGSLWPFRDFRWWWSAPAEPSYGRFSVNLTYYPVIVGGKQVGEGWQPKVVT